MRILIPDKKTVERKSAASYPLGTLLTCADSNGLFVRLATDGKILGFRSFDIVPWVFSDDGGAYYLPASKGTKFTLEQE